MSAFVFLGDLSDLVEKELEKLLILLFYLFVETHAGFCE